MKIVIKPSDIIKRGLWDTYVYYVVGSEKESEKLLLEDKEFELSERNGIIIGLLKVMETDNLIHRFNDYFIHFLNIKSMKDGDEILIKKKFVELAILNFKEKFPTYWNCETNWKFALKDLDNYINELNSKIEKLELLTLNIKNITYEFYYSNNVRKLLNFNNY
jgi:hypothetical protein